MAPLTYDAASEARKTTAAASSSGVPMRLSGTCSVRTPSRSAGQRPLELGGADEAGRHHVAGDPVGPQLAGGGPGERDHAGLGGAVVADRGAPAYPPVDRGRVDDPAPAPSDHVRRGVLDAQEGAGEVSVEHQAPGVLRQVDQRRVQLGAEGAGVVHQDVQSPELLHRRRDRAAHVLGPPHVGAQDQRLAARLPALLRRLLGPAQVAVPDDRHVGAGPGEGHRLRAAQAAAGAGHHRHPALAHGIRRRRAPAGGGPAGSPRPGP